MSSRDWIGRPVLLNFWATWCAPCREEMPSLQRLAEREPELRVVGMSVDQDLNLAREFLLKYQIGFENVFDPGGRIATTVFGIRAYPSTFVIGRDGRVVALIQGGRDWASDATRAEIRSALAAQ